MSGCTPSRNRVITSKPGSNAKIHKALAEVESDLPSIPATPTSTRAVQRIEEAIQKGRSLLEERQELIHLADRSKHGWSVVEEYKAEDLPDDSDDECRIEKLESRIEEGWEVAQEVQHAGRADDVLHWPSYRDATANSGGMPAAMAPFARPKRQVVPTETRPTCIGPCHFCGEMGHLRLYYPARVAAGNRNWYPSQVECATSVDVQ